MKVRIRNVSMGGYSEFFIEDSCNDSINIGYKKDKISIPKEFIDQLYKFMRLIKDEGNLIIE